MITSKINSEASDFAGLVRRMASDKRMGAVHVSLCAALFVLWQRDSFQNPFAISRKSLMAYSRIAATAPSVETRQQAAEFVVARDADGGTQFAREPLQHRAGVFPRRIGNGRTGDQR